MLYPSDFRVEDGVDYIDLTSDDFRSFKSEAGDQAIPLHPDRSGPIMTTRLCEAHGSSIVQTFVPGMKYRKGVPQRAANISKWFLRWRRKLGIIGEKTPFHAFRNTFSTALKKKFVGADTIDQMVGHEPGSVGAGHYTDPLPIRTKVEAINKIDYEVDLSLVIAALSGRHLATE